jgi:hypothetical protein
MISTSSGNVWLKPFKMTLTVVTVAGFAPLTVICEGYGVALVLSLMVIGLLLPKICRPPPDAA